MPAYPFGRGIRYDELLDRLLSMDCSIQEWIAAGEIQDADGAPCPQLLRVSRVDQGEIKECPLTRYPEDEWAFPSVIESIESALNIDLSDLH